MKRTNVRRSSTERARSAGIVVVLALATTAIGGAADASAPPATDAPQASDTDSEFRTECPADEQVETLTMATVSPARGFDPTLPARGTLGGHMLAAVFDTLLQHDRDSGEVRPRLAESMVPNDDVTEWTLTLRDGITFGSGNPVTTEAVAFSVNLHRAEDSTSIYREATQLIEEIEIVDDRTIVFKLSESWGGLPVLLAGSVGFVVDPAVWEELGEEAFSSDPQGGGAGPYVLERWAEGEEMVLRAKDDYWGGALCMDSIRFITLEDGPRLDAMQNGDIDVIWARNAITNDELKEMGFDYFENLINSGSGFVVNHGARGVDRPGKDVRTRRAIALALDPTVIDERINLGHGVPSDKMLVSERSELWSPEIEPMPYDPEEARRLLDEVKAETGYDGHLTYLSSNTQSAIDTSLIFEAQLEAVGFIVEVDNTRDPGQQNSYYNETADFDIMGFGLSMMDADPWLGIQLSVYREWLGFQPSPEWTESMAALRSAITLEEKRVAMVAVNEAWLQDMPIMSHGHSAEMVAWQPWVDGLEFTSDTIALFHNARAAG